MNNKNMQFVVRKVGNSTFYVVSSRYRWPRWPSVPVHSGREVTSCRGNSCLRMSFEATALTEEASGCLFVGVFLWDACISQQRVVFFWFGDWMSPDSPARMLFWGRVWCVVSMLLGQSVVANAYSNCVSGVCLEGFLSRTILFAPCCMSFWNVLRSLCDTGSPWNSCPDDSWCREVCRMELFSVCRMKPKKFLGSSKCWKTCWWMSRPLGFEWIQFISIVSELELLYYKVLNPLFWSPRLWGVSFVGNHFCTQNSSVLGWGSIYFQKPATSMTNWNYQLCVG